MPSPVRRLVLLAALVLAAALLVAACGGGDGDGEDVTAELTPAEILAQSAEKAEALESFRISFEAAGRVDIRDEGAVPGGGLLSGPLEISGEGPVQPPDRASVDARIGLSGPALQGNLTRVGDDVFVGVLGQDFSVALPPEQVALLDFGELYPTLVRWTADPAESGREEVGGADTVQITGAIDPEAALADLGPLLGSEGATPAQARAALREGTVEAWVGTSDLLPRRVHLVLKADGTRLGAGVGAVDIDLTADLSAFDEPVDIQAPRDARPLDLDQLGSLTGG